MLELIQLLGPTQMALKVLQDYILCIYLYLSLVQNLTMFANSSFTISRDGRRNISEGVSLLDFRRLYHTNATQVANLTSYMYTESSIEFIRPDSSIAGTYTCTLNEFESLNVSVNVRSKYILY